MLINIYGSAIREFRLQVTTPESFFNAAGIQKSPHALPEAKAGGLF